MTTSGNDYEQLPANTSDDLNQTLPRQGRQSSSLGSTRYPEVVVMVDYSLYVKFQYNMAVTRQYVISHFNTVNFR